MSAPQRDETPPKGRQPAEPAGDEQARNEADATPFPAPRFPRPTTRGQAEFIRALQLLERAAQAFPDVRFDGTRPDSD
jgi:hypothetical protein